MCDVPLCELFEVAVGIFAQVCGPEWAALELSLSDGDPCIYQVQLATSERDTATDFLVTGTCNVPENRQPVIIEANRTTGAWYRFR